MNFWDSSALVPLVLEEESSAAVERLYQESGSPIAWYFTPVEIIGALYRTMRHQNLSYDDLRRLFSFWQELEEEIHYIDEIEEVRRRAIRIIQTHSLRAADALQLAAALVACSEDGTGDHRFVTLDRTLGEAARKEGFRVCP